LLLVAGGDLGIAIAFDFPVGSLHAQARCRQCSLSQDVNSLLALVRARASADATRRANKEQMSTVWSD
jgi:hypothetical protein